jgi:hypothetical protein
MSTNCNTCDDSGIALGSRALSGNGFSQGSLTTTARENLMFRVQSITSVLMGATSTDGMSPIERRQKLQENRRKLMREMPGPLGGMMGDTADSDMAGSNSGSGESEGSGQISSAGTSPSSSSMDTVQDSTPSMSNVSRGTKERADNRGFGY